MDWLHRPPGRLIDDTVADDTFVRGYHRHQLPVRCLRHGRGTDPGGRAAGPDAPARRDGAACGHPDRLQPVARDPVVAAHSLVRGVALSTGIAGRAGGVVAVAVCAEQAVRRADAGCHAVHGQAASPDLETATGADVARSDLRIGLDDAVAVDRRVRTAG